MQTSISAKSLRVSFDKVDGFIRVYDGTIYLVMFGPEKYDTVYNRTIYLTSQKVVLHMLFLIIMHCMYGMGVMMY